MTSADQQGRTHLSSGSDVLDRMHGQTEDVVVVFVVEPLAVFVTWQDDRQRGHVVHNLAALRVE